MLCALHALPPDDSEPSASPLAFSSFACGHKYAPPGAVVGAGELLFEIVPNQDQLVMEARVRPVDIGSITLGMPARVHFSTLSRQE